MKLLVDGDVIAYRASSSCELSKKKIAEGKTEIDPDFAAWSRASTMIDQMIDACLAQDAKIYLTGKGNFRYDLYPLYKANRSSVKPTHLESTREYLIRRWNAVVVDGIEADDAIIMDWVPYETIICSNDKDFPANAYGHFYNFTKPEGERFFEVTEDEMHFNFAKQMLMGDRADNIVGPYGFDSVKKVERILKLGPPYESIIKHHYILNFIDNPDGVQQLNFRLLRLLRTLDELDEIRREKEANIYTLPQAQGEGSTEACSDEDPDYLSDAAAR